VNLTSPNGQVGWVDDAQADAALKAGYRPSTDDEVKRAKAGDQPGRAALEGLARGATAGVSDVVLTGALKGAGADPGDVLRRKEENPVASTAGEIGGLVVPGPTAAKGIGKVEGAVKGLFAGKNTARLASGVTGGGIWGLGTVISEDALHDRELTGENLTAGVMGSALAGGVANVAFGKAGDMTRSALVKAFGGGALKTSLEDLASKATMRQVMLPGDMAKNGLRGRKDKIGKFINEEVGVGGAPTAAEMARRASDRAGVAKQEVDSAIGQLGPAKFDVDTLRSRIEVEVLDPIRDIPSKGESVKTITKWLEDFYEEVTVPVILSPSSPAGAATTKKILQPKPKNFQQIWDELSALRNRVGAQDPNYNSVKDDIFAARGIAQEEFFTQAGKVKPDVEAALRKGNDELASAAQFAKLATKTSDRQAQNRGISLTDYGVGIGAAHAGFGAFGLPGLAAGAVASAANKVARERGGFVLGSALHKMSKSKVLNRMADSLAKRMEKALKDDAVFGGTFRTILETSAAKGAMDLLETHVTLAQTDPSYLPSIGLQDEDPATLPEYADRAQRLGTLQNSTEDMQAGIDQAIDQMIKGSGKGKSPAVTLSRKDYEGMVEGLRKLKMDSESIKKSVGEIAPTTAAMASMGVVNGARFLLDKAPQNPNENLPVALQRPWAPTREELNTWNRYVRAVANPASVFQDIESGTVTPEGTEALRTIYPRLYKEFRDRLSSRLADLKDPLDRKKRAQVAVILGDLDDPAQVALIQAMHARNKPAEPQKPDGREKIDVQRNLMTQGQRLANKEDR
jgi:hypothetical protein